ncbi:L,D-transpeptidase [Candidatus Binatus sp.]|uniref:L,D-transpeptidase n=1 Tax=Candidatus Binatus sp. TaxID=2811406 RepID=UPI003CB3F074
MTTSIGKLTTAIIFAFLLLATTAPRAEEPAAPLPPISHQISGGEFDFIVWEGSTFTSIGSRFGESPKVLALENGKQVTDRLHAGDTVHIDNRHIVPIEDADLIEVNLPQRMLFHFEGGRLRGAYPVAIGQPARQWQTPIGAFKVIQLQEDPTWRVPASIQREEEEAGKDVEDEVDPGPDNPLGKYWIGLSFPVIGIHGTNHPVSVYSYRTHGCVRLHPDDIEALFNDVDLNDRGVIAYYPLMLARLDDGRIFLESDRDIYRRGTGGIDAVKALARADGIDTLIDWSRAGEVLDDQEGIARDVTLGSERARGTPANSIAATTSDRKARVATDASRGIIAEELPPH